MTLTTIDWFIIFAFFLISLGIGIYASKTAGRSSSQFFLSNRNMPWWLLGFSMVATTFAADTPNLVTDIVRQNGVSGNWAWWAFLLTGMLTVFIFAKLWQRSNVNTDIEFYELRYSGKMARFLRAFRAIYLGLLLNVLIMATVTLAMIKIAAVLLNWSATETIVIGLSITLLYSVLGGLKGVILTDFFQFSLAMIGSISAAIYVINRPEIGGLTELLVHVNVSDKLNFFPDFSNTDELLTLLILPIAVQWWSVWYPGSEPGGGGYIAQRMLSAKSENDSIAATLFFNVAHYALRPWPWILIALASLVMFPTIADLQKAFPGIDPTLIKHDFAYPAMLSLLPKGLLGLVIASLIAAFMSTISTHLNWGSSYIVNDVYKRFLKPQANEKELVLVGRLSMIAMAFLTAFVVLFLENAKQAFDVLILLGAGTGLIYILRWFWWRVNAQAELTAMIVSFLIAIYFKFVHQALGFEASSTSFQLIFGVAFTSFAWILVAFKTKATDSKTLMNFYSLVKPGGAGWAPIQEKLKKEGVLGTEKWYVPNGILSMISGCFLIYSLLFASGSLIYGNYLIATFTFLISLISAYILKLNWSKLK